MRKTLFALLARESEPMSRTELWLGLVTVYLVVAAMLMGHFTSYAGTADQYTVKPLIRLS